MKENNTILYVNKKSNHPPSTLKNIPESVNNRLTRNSKNENVFTEKYNHSRKNYMVQPTLFFKCENKHRQNILKNYL